MSFRNSIPLLTGLLLLIAGGIVHGRWSGRWTTTDLNGIAARVHNVPRQINDWICIEEGTVSDDELKLAELSSYCMRHYRHQRTGAIVTLLLMCGSTGPIAVHPPTACYVGQGYEQVGDLQLHRVAFEERGNPSRSGSDAAPTDSLMTAQFRKPGRGNSQKARIFWSWTADGHWSTPASPRIEFAGCPALFKLYVTQEAHDLLPLDGTTPPEEFLRELLPVIRQSVFQVESSAPDAVS
ncbi:exosortase-associated EpsI family protein [bacterium]|nr:exosortase-associated EpsI family protein [bacterium]